MKKHLTGILIGVAIAAAAFALYGFTGSAQSDNVGRFKLHTIGDGSPNSKTFLIDSATGDVWRESSSDWIALKRPRTSGE